MLQLMKLTYMFNKKYPPKCKSFRRILNKILIFKIISFLDLCLHKLFLIDPSKIILINFQQKSQMIHSFQTQNYLFGTMVVELMRLTADIYYFCMPPNCMFRMVQSANLDPLKLTTFQTPNPNLPLVRDFTSSYLVYDQVNLNTPQLFGIYELYESLDYDDAVNSLVTDYLSQNVRRIIIHRYSKSTVDYSWNIMKVFPCEKISFNQIQNLHENNPIYLKAEAYKGSTVMIHGPYIDQLGNFQENLTAFIVNISRPAFSALKPQLYFQITIEIETQLIRNLFIQNYYRSTIEMIVVNKNGQLLQATDYWLQNDKLSPQQYIFDVQIQPYSGLSPTAYHDLMLNSITNDNYTSLTQIMKLNKNNENKQYLIYPVIIQDTFNPNNMTDYTLIGIPNQNADYIAAIIYGEQDQMYSVSNFLNEIYIEELEVLKNFSVLTGIITVCMVIVSLYHASVSVHRPIRQMLYICQSLSHKDSIFRLKVLQKAKFQLEDLETQTQYQVQDLVNSFICLITTIISRIKTPNTLKKIIINYPLNELEKNFAKNTKGKQFQFDWQKLVDQIEDKPDQISN
ncbi:transmembrane protein, putative (macronuclear) [Tetrahymena thermophila SB210]|uniref:Transmembrane protein, putative n=1 Tax=Tetrahymena thermophila (strain SB210) TaxID=312017 RepID=Q24FT9_TETTS|nr:transmembrane protein, putative [Tetrahymena thermophila SB210]EAS06671.2 transmembrane protein, putative [Tetrahymena thermophila SB210]|eukprot:XP_001026916.2 transmembrane protein, putative [Tetrahymena thermophila SB210]